jgi:hypothetical protein
VGFDSSEVNTAGWQLIKYANSGGVSGIKDQVVGYAAISFLWRDAINRVSPSPKPPSGLKNPQKQNLTV